MLQYVPSIIERIISLLMPCCSVGTGVRKAVYDGYPGSQIVCYELIPEFLAFGHKLYADEHTTPIRFI